MAKKNIKRKTAMNCLVFLFLTLFPVIYDNFYFNITLTKYKTFIFLATAIFFVAVSYNLSSNIRKNHGLKIQPPLYYLKRLTGSDWLFLFFLLTGIISCLHSEWPAASFTGSSGKYVGLLFLLLAGAMYYGITRYFSWSPLIKYTFPVILTFISLMSVMQFCGKDVLGFYADIADGTSQMYIATFGHIDVFSAFLCVYLPICMMSFLCENKLALIFLYGTGSFMGFLGIFAANSDSSYLGLLVSIVTLMILSFRDTGKIKKFSMLLSIFTASALLWQLLHQIFREDMRTMSAITTEITSSLGILCLFLICFGLFALGEYYSRRHTNPPAILPLVLTIIIILSFLSVLAAIFWFSVKDTSTELGALENYLRFNNHWGSDRGYVWSWLIQIFVASSWITKLFGAGPDTTKLLLYKYYETEMSDKLGVFYASAHNEYLNYLVTLGIIGTLLYLLLLIVSVINCIKKSSSDYFYGAIGLAIISYAAMAFVNISQPITMPFIFLLISFANLRNKG